MTQKRTKTHTQVLAELNHDGINADLVPVGNTVEVKCGPFLDRYYFCFNRVSETEWKTYTRLTPSYGRNVYAA